MPRGGRLRTGYGTTAKVAGGGIGGPLGPKPRPSKTSSTVGRIPFARVCSACDSVGLTVSTMS